MGFAELSIADLATEYEINIEKVFALCDQLNINYKNEHTCLALEDAKAVILLILSARTDSEQSLESA